MINGLYNIVNYCQLITKLSVFGVDGTPGWAVGCLLYVFNPFMYEAMNIRRNVYYEHVKRR